MLHQKTIWRANQRLEKKEPGFVKHNSKTNHDFNFKDFKIYFIENTEKLLFERTFKPQ